MIYFEDAAQIAQRIAARQVPVGFIGLGRVGLPLAAILAEAGFNVTGIDIRSQLVQTINQGKSPYTDEQGLQELIQKVVAAGRLKAYDDIKQAVDCEVYIIAVPTLISGDEPDITAVYNVAEQLGTIFKPGKLAVLQSTVPPNTTRNVLGATLARHISLEAGRGFGLAYSPERTQSPQVLRDLKTYPKIIGAIDEKSASILAQIYSTFAPSVIKMSSIAAAELDKVVENTYRDVNIAFANELALLCQIYGVDVTELIATANSQPYSHILQPGLVGGHCIPMDPYYIISDAKQRGFLPLLINAARTLNEGMFDVVAGMVPATAKKVAVLGLSFKPDVRSFETSHTPRLVARLEARGFTVTVHDPYLEGARYNFETTTDVYQAAQGADALILSTAHSEYRQLDFERLKTLMQGNVIVDVRNIFDAKKVKQAGFIYKGLGRNFNE